MMENKPLSDKVLLAKTMREEFKEFDWYLKEGNE